MKNIFFTMLKLKGILVGGPIPTKDEFYEKMDEVLGEIKDMREEFSVTKSRVYDNHEPRIGKVEKKLGIQPTL